MVGKSDLLCGEENINEIKVEYGLFSGGAGLLQLYLAKEEPMKNKDIKMDTNKMNSATENREKLQKKRLNDIKDMLSQGKTVFLIGAGCSKCVGLPLVCELGDKIQEKMDDKNKKILSEIKKNFKAKARATIEDYMSEIVDFISILNRRSESEEKEKIKIGEMEVSLKELSDLLEKIKNLIASIIKDIQIDISIHRKFMKSLFQSRKNRPDAHLPIDFFVLNYDTLFEDALGLEQIKSSDGFNGSATAYWDIKHYFEDKLAKARVFKIHGSIDWSLLEASGSQITPFRIREKIKIDNKKSNVLIWPTTSKYREAQNNPYLQIIQAFKQSLQQGHSIVLAVLGYSFEDHHINEEIRISLEQYGTELSIIIFTEKSPDNTPFLKEVRENFLGQVKIYSGEGFFHADEEDLECTIWKFEDIAKILNEEGL